MAYGKSGRNVLQPHERSIRSNGGFLAYSDSSWGPGVAYPMYGYIIYMFGGIISFASKQLKIVCFSPCEAEYAAAANCCKEIAFIRKICDEMGFVLNGQLVLIVDNTAAIDTANNIGVSAKTKHFETCVHYFRHEVQHGRIFPVHVLTNYQRADGFTKGLDKAKFIQWLRDIYNLHAHTTYKGVSKALHILQGAMVSRFY